MLNSDLAILIQEINRSKIRLNPEDHKLVNDLLNRNKAEKGKIISLTAKEERDIQLIYRKSQGA